MGDWDIGLALVAARLASSGKGKGLQLPVPRATRAPDPGRWGTGENRRRPLPGVKMEVIDGNLLLIPCVDPPKTGRPADWTPSREEGGDVHIGKSETVRPPGER